MGFPSLSDHPQNLMTSIFVAPSATLMYSISLESPYQLQFLGLLVKSVETI